VALSRERASVMGATRERPAATAAWRRVHWLGLLVLLGGCSVGHGSGEISGAVAIDDCRPEGPYQLRPTTFFAEAAEQVLDLRVQRGSDTEMLSDGVSVLIDDAALVKRSLLEMDLPIGVDVEPRIELSFYLNETCPAERDKTPVALGAVSGSIRFSEIYAPRVDKDEVRIAAVLTNVRFEDPRNAARWAVLSGNFDFLYVRGSPAQRFP
jgi:hypothetical protein